MNEARSCAEERPLPGPAAWLGAALMAAGWSWIRPTLAPLPGGARAGLGLLAAGALLFLGHGLRRRRPGTGFLLALATAAMLGILDLGLTWFDAVHAPALPVFSWIARAAAFACGIPAALVHQNLLVQDSQGGFAFAPTFGLTAFPVLARFLGAAALLLVLRKPGNRGGTFFRIALTSLFFFGLAYSLQVFRFAGTDRALDPKAGRTLLLFASPLAFAIPLLLSALTAAALDRPASWRRGASPAPAGRRLAWLLLSGLALGGAFGWHDPGTPKPGRVLVDERLAGFWEPAGRRLDTSRYGDFSAYSFSAMVEHLSRRFTVQVNGSHAYTREFLDGFDVLILKTPEKPLAPEEIAAIQGWVRDGGGLFAIGDHTDLLGMSTHLNRLLEDFGIRFRFDATSHLADGGFDFWQPPWLFEHPVSAGIGPMEFMTACSIELLHGGQPVLTLSGSAAAGGDYANPSHFGTLAPDPSRPQGVLLAAAAVDAGKGRVLAFGDSTVFSSFAYYLWSRADFALRSVAWLNRTRSPGVWIGRSLAALGFLCLLLGLAARGAGAAGICGGALLFSLALFGGAWGAGWVSARALVIPAPIGRTATVGFVVEGGYAALPAVLGTQPDLPPHSNFQTFVQTPQRLGFETRVVPRDPRILADLDALVLLNPETTPGGPEAPPGWVQAVLAWVRAGGRLVVLERAAHAGHDHDRAGLYLKNDFAWEPADSPVPGIVLLTARVGKGLVVGVLGSEELAVDSMGHCMAFPGRDQRLRYETAYRVFGDLLGLPEPDRRTYRPE